jgi:hypothetical protein
MCSSAVVLWYSMMPAPAFPMNLGLFWKREEEKNLILFPFPSPVGTFGAEIPSMKKATAKAMRPPRNGASELFYCSRKAEGQGKYFSPQLQPFLCY